jgi:DNA-binding transcriptional LysR family regulator
MEPCRGGAATTSTQFRAIFLLSVWLLFPFLLIVLVIPGDQILRAPLKMQVWRLDITLAASDTDVIKTYVRLGMGAGIIAAMAYDPVTDQDLVARDLSHLIPSSRTKIAYLKHNYLPSYSQHFIDELLMAAKEMSC